MQKLVTRTLVFLIALLLMLGSAASALALGHVEAKTVRVGFYRIDGYHVMDDEGNRSGYGYEVLQAMKLYNNWEYEYIGYDKGWADIQQMLLDGQIDMVISAVKTPAREEIYDFSELAVSQSGTCLLVKAGQSPYVAGEYANYNGMRIGFIEGASQIASAAAFAAEKEFSYTPVYYKTSDELEQAVLAGTDVDAIVTSNMRIVSGTRRLELFAIQDVHAIVQKGNTELLAEIDYALEQISLYTPSLYDSLYNKYYSIDTGDEVFFSPQEAALIAEFQKSETKLKVTIVPDMAPYAYIEDGAPAGLLYDISSEILRRTGLEYEIVTADTNAGYRELVETGAVDIRLAARFDYNDAEKLGYTLADPYYTSNISRVIRKDHKGDIKTIATVGDSSISNYYLPKIADHETVKVFGTADECVKAVLNGSCDALYFYTRMAQDVVYSDETNRLTSVIMPGFDSGFSIGVHENIDARVASIIEKATLSLSEDDVSQYVLKYTNNSAKSTTFIGALYNNPLFVIALVVLVLVIIFSIVMMVFIMRKRRLEKEKNEELEEALALAEQASAAKSMFMSRMSHEIRTPLNAIIGYNTISEKTLADAQSDSEYKQAALATKEYLAKSDTASKNLLMVINDVLDMSSIESGKLKLAHEPFGLRDLISALDSMFLMQANEKDVSFEVVYATEVDQELVGDQMRVNQVLANLLSNAVKFTPAGGQVRLKVSQTEVGDGTVTIHCEVKDSGIGMSKEFLEDIWRPFEQEDASISRRYGGTGLGLSITKNLIDLMGGSISAQSEEGVGSTFGVDFVFGRVADVPQDAIGSPDAGEERVPTVAKKPSAPFDGARILMAEDNEMNREIMRRILASWGMLVDEAHDGQEAVALFTAAPAGSYQAILMDIHMPQMDGHQATQAIRTSAHPDASTIPIIAMTADVFAENVTDAMMVGMNAHVGKPIEVAVLRDTLHKYIH